jgi:CBS-domain-containing membrane protein
MKPLEALTAWELMSREVIQVPRWMTLRNAARLLLQSQISGAPVVDEGGRCVGVLSALDFVRWAEKGPDRGPAAPTMSPFSEWQVEDLEEVPEEAVSLHMTPDPVMMATGATVGELARAMLDAHIHRVIIVNADRRPVGIVTSTDILAAVAYRNCDE